MAVHTEFTIPLPPSANNMNRGTGKGVYNTKRYRDWKKAAGAMIMVLRPRPRLFDVPVAIHLSFGLDPNRAGRKPDPDNYIKPTVDLLQEMRILSNDSVRQVHHVGITYDPAMPEQMHVKLIPSRAS